MAKTSYNTVQELLDGGYTVHVYCHTYSDRGVPCHHSVKLDLAKLRERLGPDFPVTHDDLLPKLVCSKCGGKKLGMTKSPPSKASERNPYLRAKGE